MQTKHLILTLLLLASCKAGDSASTTQNILNCQNYGSVTESTTTETTNEAESTSDALDESIDFQQSEPSTTTPENTGIQPVVPGLGIGIVKSAIDAIDANSCESVGLCVIVGMDRDKVVVEHCNDISFPGAE